VDDEAEEPTTTGEDAGMLLDSIIAAVPNGDDLHRLRVAAFENPDELSQGGGSKHHRGMAL